MRYRWTVRSFRSGLRAPYWYAPAEFQGTVPFELRVLQRTAYVVANRIMAYAQATPTTNAWRFEVSFADDGLEPRP
jgi:hypothetical protein